MSDFPTAAFDPDAQDLDVCPACGDSVRLPRDIVLGEVIWCRHCGAELEVTSTEPLLLGLYEDEEK